jgi:anti-sigma B factor antagonist
VSASAPPDSVVVRCARPLLYDNREPLKSSVLDHLASGATAIVIDLTDCHYIDSSGLGMLVSLRNKAQQLGATITLAGLDGDLRALFEVTKLDHLFVFAEPAPGLHLVEDDAVLVVSDSDRKDELLTHAKLAGHLARPLALAVRALNNTVFGRAIDPPTRRRMTRVAHFILALDVAPNAGAARIANYALHLIDDGPEPADVRSIIPLCKAVAADAEADGIDYVTRLESALNLLNPETPG